MDENLIENCWLLTAHNNIRNNDFITKAEQRKIPKCIVQVPFSKMGVTVHLEKSIKMLQAKK